MTFIQKNHTRFVKRTAWFHDSDILNAGSMFPHNKRISARQLVFLLFQISNNVGSLEAGKAVFSEKPIAEAPSGTARCYKKADEVGKPLFCAFNRRFDPSFASIRAKVHNGEVGHVQMIKTTSRDSPLPSIEYLKIRLLMY